MNKEILKGLLIRDKQFLRSIYEGPNVLKNKRVLNATDDAQINTLLKYLYCVTNGIIEINESNFMQIKKKKALFNLLQTKLDTKNDLQLLLSGKRIEKLNFILKLSPILPYLMYGLFNLELKLKKETKL